MMKAHNSNLPVTLSGKKFQIPARENTSSFGL
jgi:hypothetical protein